MQKLLDTYRRIPTMMNAKKLQAYARKHPFATCFMSDQDHATLAEAVHHADKGHRA